jgi:hypothetical protein
MADGVKRGAVVDIFLSSGVKLTDIRFMVAKEAERRCASLSKLYDMVFEHRVAAGSRSARRP